MSGSGGEPRQEGKDCMTHGEHRNECADMYERLEKFVCLKTKPLDTAMTTCKNDLLDKLNFQRFFLVVIFICVVGGGFWANGNSSAISAQEAKIEAQENDRGRVIKRIDKLEDRIDTQHEQLDTQYRNIMNEIRRLHKIDPILTPE